MGFGATGGHGGSSLLSVVLWANLGIGLGLVYPPPSILRGGSAWADSHTPRGLFFFLNISEQSLHPTPQRERLVLG
jgi:hypothetical protein